jgi:four helix bundle protein
MPSRTFRDLIVWQKAHEWVLAIYELTSQFPREEMFGLTSQLRRAAVSVPANIAEGFAKTGRGDKLRFYNIAQGSIEECRYYLLLAQDLGYADTTTEAEQLTEVSRLLQGYISSLRTSRLGGRLSPLYWLLATGYWILP